MMYSVSVSSLSSNEMSQHLVASPRDMGPDVETVAFSTIFFPSHDHSTTTLPFQYVRVS